MTARHRGVVLRCDHHEIIGSCVSSQAVPEARTIPEARKIAKGVGWRYRRRPRTDAGYYVDLCPTCATIYGRAAADAREIPGQTAIEAPA